MIHRSYSHSVGDAAKPVQPVPAQSRIHWPTVLFGALPATYFALPAGVGILLGFLGGRGMLSNAVFFAGLFWWIAMIALWGAARNGSAIGKRTAVGLLLGLISVVIYAVLFWMDNGFSGSLAWFPPVILVGPVLVSLAHLNRFWKSRHTEAAAQSVHTPASPPSETSTRRVELALRVVLLAQVYAYILFAALMPWDGAGLGGLMMMVLAFPVALGVASFCVWAFARHRPIRPWAAAVFFAPVILWVILRIVVKVLGEPTIAEACGHAAPWVPLAAILLFPRTAGRLVPGFLRGRAACITYAVFLGLMNVPWLFVWLDFDRWIKTGSPEKGLFIWVYPAMSVTVGVIGLLFSYVGLFRKRGERQLVLSIAHMVLSLLLIAAAIPFLLILYVAMMSLG